MPEPAPSVNEEHHYQVLKHLAANPQATQRDLAKALGLSLGSTNDCIRAVIDQAWLKVQNFRNSHNKRAYAYLLTPDGLATKARLTARFLQRKRVEYATLKTEIAPLTAELQARPESITTTPAAPKRIAPNLQPSGPTTAWPAPTPLPPHRWLDRLVNVAGPWASHLLHPRLRP